MTDRLRVAILGSTGSIGRQALDVASKHADKVEVVALAAYASDTLLLSQAREHGVARIALSDPAAASRASLQVALDDPFTTVDCGPEAVVSFAAEAGADVVLNALVGAAGLRASLAALSAGADYEAAAELANCAAGVVVGKLGTATCTDRELLDYLDMLTRTGVKTVGRS